MSRKPSLAQAVKPDTLNPAISAIQPGKIPVQNTMKVGKQQKPFIDEDQDLADQSLDTAESTAADAGSSEWADSGVHLAQAAGTASDAPPAAAGSMSASSAGGATAGTAAMAGISTGMMIAGGVVLLAAAVGSNSDDDTATVSSTVSGSVIGGPVVAGSGLTVNLYKADGTTLLGTGTLNETGQFSIDVGSYTGVVIARVVDANANPDYIDETTGQAVDLAANLMAVGIASGGTVTLNINPLTTVAALKAGANPTADTVNQTNTAVAQAFGLSDLTGTSVVTTVNADGASNQTYNPADGLSNAEKYGAVLAALSGMDQSGGAQNTIDSLAANLNISGSTGSLNATALDSLLTGAATADGNSTGNLIGAISDTLAKTSASVSINPIAGDNAINAAEAGAGVTLTGSNAAGATIALSIGGNTRNATVDGTTWSYTLVAGDYTAIGEGGETITATSTLTTGTGANTTTTTATATRSITVDTAAPTLAITSNDAALIGGETATVSFTFSEAPSGFAAADITTTGGTLSGLSATADAKVYTATFTPTPNTASGNASITVAAGAYTDAAGNNGGAGTTPAISFDTLVPTLAITSDVAAVKIGETATITFTFSETPTGFAAGDITTTGGTLSGLAVTGDDKVYTATFTPTAGTASGNASITVAAGNYTDAAGNAGAAGTTPTIAIDTLAPTLAITSNDAALKIGETANITFTFSEAPIGFDAGDISTSGGNLTGLAVSQTDAKVYTATFTPTADTASGNASITVAASTFTDAAGNNGDAGVTPAIAIDTLAPTIAINPVTGDNVINASEYTNAVVVSGTATGADGQTVTVMLNSQSYTGTVSSGAWSVTVPVGAVGVLTDLTTYPVTANVSDLAGNPAAQASQSVLIAISGPVIQINPIAGDNFINAAENDAAVTISGTVSGANGQTLTLNLNGQSYTSVVTDGAWSVTVDAGTIGALADNNYNVTADVSDSTGNPAQQAVRSLVVDTGIATPTVALGNDNGSSNSDGLTNDASLSLSAAAGDVSRTFAVDGAAASATYTPPTTDGSHTVVVTDTDTAGNSANASLTFTLDKTLATPTVALTTDTGSSNSDRISSDVGSLTTSATAVDVSRTFAVDGGAAGASYTAPTTDGSHTVVVTDTDTAGNTANASLTFTRDTTAPTLTVSGVDIGTDSGSSASDFYTNTAAQTITGTLSNPLDTGDTIFGSVDNGANWTDITANVSGTAINWTGATLAGSDTIGFKVTDSAGNTGATTGSQGYTVDSTAPSFSSGASAVFPNQGTGTAYTATASDASQVSYSLAGADAAAFDIDANTGAVTFKTAPSTAAPTDAGANNVYNIDAVATDLAGNSSSQAVAITVVNAPSLASTLDNVANLEITSNIVLTASENVTAVADKYIHIINDGGTGFHGESIVNTQDILVTDTAKVTIVGDKITINPQFDLDFNNNYHIEIDAGAFLGVSSGQASVAIADAQALNFSTVNPSASATATSSQAMNSGTDAMVAGHNWWDAEGNGAPGGSAVARDFAEGNNAIAANDLATTGIATNDYYIAVNNFGAGDLIYFDNHGDNAVQRQSDFNAGLIVDLGTPPTQIISGASGTATGQNGGQFDVTLAGLTDTFADTTALQTLLQVSYLPILYG